MDDFGNFKNLDKWKKWISLIFHIDDLKEYDLVKKLFKCYPSFKHLIVRPIDGIDLLDYYISECNEKIVDFLVNQCGFETKEKINRAIESKNEKILKTIIYSKKGCDVNHIDSDSKLHPLEKAIDLEKGFNIFELLLKAGSRTKYNNNDLLSTKCKKLKYFNLLLKYTWLGDRYYAGNFAPKEKEYFPNVMEKGFKLGGVMTVFEILKYNPRKEVVDKFREYYRKMMGPDPNRREDFSLMFYLNHCLDKYRQTIPSLKNIIIESMDKQEKSYNEWISEVTKHYTYLYVWENKLSQPWGIIKKDMKTFKKYGYSKTLHLMMKKNSRKSDRKRAFAWIEKYPDEKKKLEK